MINPHSYILIQSNSAGKSPKKQSERVRFC